MIELFICLGGMVILLTLCAWLIVRLGRELLTDRTAGAIMLALSKGGSYGMTSRLVENVLVQDVNECPELRGFLSVFEEAVRRLVENEYISAREATKQEVIRLHNLEERYGVYAIDRANFLGQIDRYFGSRPNMLLRLTEAGREILPT